MITYIPAFLLSLALLGGAAFWIKFAEPVITPPGVFLDVSLEDAPPGLPDTSPAAAEEAPAAPQPEENTPPAPPTELPLPQPLDDIPPPPIPFEETPPEPIEEEPPEMINPLAENLPAFVAPPKPTPPKPKPTTKPKATTAKPTAPSPKPPSTNTTSGGPSSGQSSGGSPGSSGGGGKSNGASYRYSPKPSYPSAEKKAGIQGSVLLKVSLDANGRPTAVTVISSSGSPALDQAARNSVASQWRFNPALKDGTPIPSTVNVPIEFRLR